MNARQYYHYIVQLIVEHSPSIAFNISFNEIDINECYIKGVLTLDNGYELYFAEYVITEPYPQLLKYRYHLQKPDGTQVVRWDNVAHHANLSTFPYHKHNKTDAAYPSDRNRCLSLNFISASLSEIRA